MVSNATLSTISSLIKSMRTRKASKYDFIVHVDSKGFKAHDGETHYHCGVPNKPDGTPNDVTTLFTDFVRTTLKSRSVSGIGLQEYRV